MAMGRGRVGLKDGVFIPVLHGFILSYPRSLGPREVPSHCIKLYFLLIYPTTSTIFFNETYFINKNIPEITTKFIPSNQINF